MLPVECFSIRVNLYKSFGWLLLFIGFLLTTRVAINNLSFACRVITTIRTKNVCVSFVLGQIKMLCQISWPKTAGKQTIRALLCTQLYFSAQ